MRLETIARAVTAVANAVAAFVSRLANRVAEEDLGIELRRACVRVPHRRR